MDETSNGAMVVCGQSGYLPHTGARLLKRSFSMARKRSQDNRAEVYASDRCGCFHCGATYAARTVDQWYSSRQEVTAVCPECGIDAVLGDASGYPLTEAFLGGMRLRWFGEE